MKKLVRNPVIQVFLIGALLGAVFFLGIYGFEVLDVTNDSWLLTGRDLQQHYVGWKYFRAADWSFPLGVHNGLTYPYKVSVLYTDSIPLFAIFFKILSPILPETFQYFGLFGLMCYVLNGGFASVLIAKLNKSKLFCAMGSIFFILSTPVLQRLFGLLTENSRHTSLASHFLILAAVGVWMYRESFRDYRKAALAYSILGVLCVMIQMYIIFIVGGVMCGYLLHFVLKEKDWKRFFIVFPSFAASSLAAFFICGGFSSELIATGEGYGRYSANLNTLINPYHYSSFLGELPWNYDQYEGFAYLGLGMLSLYLVCTVVFIIKMIKIGSLKKIKAIAREKYRKHRCGILSLLCIVVVFWVLAVSTVICWGERLVVQIFPPKKLMEFMGIFRSSGRFMWIIMYLIMLFGLYLITRYVSNKKLQKVIIGLCVCIQFLDLFAPVKRIHEQFTSPAVEDNRFVPSGFWKEKLGDYKHIVYYPIGSYGLYHMLQIGTQASNHGVDQNYFYMSRFFSDDTIDEQNKATRKLFASGQLADDTLYFVDYYIAHKYKDKCYLYEVDNVIIAVKNPIPDLTPYNDIYISEEEPEVHLNFSYTGLGRRFAHSGWNNPDYDDVGMWTGVQSVIRVYSGGAKKVRITLEYEGGRKKGETIIKFNGKQKAKISDNRKSGVVTFDTEVKETVNEKKYKGLNWLFLNTDKTFMEEQGNEKQNRAIYVKKMTITYLE